VILSACTTTTTDSNPSSKNSIELSALTVEVEEYELRDSGNLGNDSSKNNSNEEAEGYKKDVKVLHYNFELLNAGDEVIGTVNGDGSNQLIVYMEAHDELLALMAENYWKIEDTEGKAPNLLSNMLGLSAKKQTYLKPNETGQYSLKYEISEGQDLNDVLEKAYNAEIVIKLGDVFEESELLKRINLKNN